MRRITLGLVAILVVSGLQMATNAPSASAAGPAYLTLLMSRVQWVQANSSCVPYANTAPLNQVADALKVRGIAATGSVVVDRTSEGTSRECEGATVYANWADLANLRDNYGWDFISHGMSHGHMTAMT